MAQKQGALKTAAFGAGGATAILLLMTGAFYLGTAADRQPRSAAVAPVVQPPKVSSVMALGRLEPNGSVIKLSVANAKDSRVDRLLVKEGDVVKAGQVIAILQGLDKQTAEVAEAQRNVNVEEAKLQLTLAGSKPGDIVAQQANVARLEAQLRTQTVQQQAAVYSANANLRTAQVMYERYQLLYRQGAVSASDLDDRQNKFATAQASLAQAQAQLANTVLTLREQIQQERATLTSVSQVRRVDARVPQAQVRYAVAQLASAQSKLEDFYVRSPVAGRILKINTHIGEQVNADAGIVDLGQTDQMYAIAEVYETDITKVQVGQPVTIESENGGFTGTLRGTVAQVGLQIQKRDVLDSDPTTDKDARVVEVKVRLNPEDSRKVEGLTYLQVRAKIQIEAQ